MGRIDMCNLARSRSHRVHAKWRSDRRGRLHNVLQAGFGSREAQLSRRASTGDALPSRNRPGTPRGARRAPRQAWQAKHAPLREEAAAQAAVVDPLSGVEHLRVLGACILNRSRGGRPLRATRLSRTRFPISRNLAPKSSILQSPAISRPITLVKHRGLS